MFSCLHFVISSLREFSKLNFEKRMWYFSIRHSMHVLTLARNNLLYAIFSILEVFLYLQNFSPIQNWIFQLRSILLSCLNQFLCLYNLSVKVFSFKQMSWGYSFVIFGVVALQIDAKLDCKRLPSNGQDALTMQLHDKDGGLQYFYLISSCYES